MAATAIAPEAAAITSPAPQPAAGAWPLWQRVLFRFFFVYLLLQIAPWFWFNDIPGVSFVEPLLRAGCELGRHPEQRARVPRAGNAGAAEWQRRHVVGVDAALALPEPCGHRVCRVERARSQAPGLRSHAVLAAHDRPVLPRHVRAELRHHQALRAADVVPDAEPARHATRRFPADAILVVVHRLLVPVPGLLGSHGDRRPACCCSTVAR